MPRVVVPPQVAPRITFPVEADDGRGMSKKVKDDVSIDKDRNIWSEMTWGRAMTRTTLSGGSYCAGNGALDVFSAVLEMGVVTLFWLCSKIQSPLINLQTDLHGVNELWEIVNVYKMLWCHFPFLKLHVPRHCNMHMQSDLNEYVVLKYTYPLCACIYFSSDFL